MMLSLLTWSSVVKICIGFQEGLVTSTSTKDGTSYVGNTRSRCLLQFETALSDGGNAQFGPALFGAGVGM